jgi:hypothetical protein
VVPSRYTPIEASPTAHQDRCRLLVASGKGDLESCQAIGVGHIEQPAEFVVAVLVLDVVNGGLYDLMAAQFLVCSPLL